MKKITALFLSILMLTIPCLINAQTPTETIEQARMDAEKDINGCFWIGLGACLTYIAVGAAYIIVPNPPSARLVGKSPEYIQVYVLAYRRQARAKQVRNSLAGCVAMLALGLVTLGIMEIAHQ